MSDIVVGLLKAFAPTVAEKLLSVIGDRRIRRDDLNLIIISLLAEQNHNIVKSMDEMCNRLYKLNEEMNTVLRELKITNEGIAVLLKRTER